MSIMLFSQAATVSTLYPVGVALGINPMLLVAMFPALQLAISSCQTIQQR